MSAGIRGEVAGGVGGAGSIAPGWRPITRGELRGIDAGRTVTGLWYTRPHEGDDQPAR